MRPFRDTRPLLQGPMQNSGQVILHGTTCRPASLRAAQPRLQGNQRAGGLLHPARPHASRAAPCPRQGWQPGAAVRAAGGGAAWAWRAEERRSDGQRWHRRLAARRCPVQRAVPQRTAHAPVARRSAVPGTVRALHPDFAGPGRRPSAGTAAAFVRMAAAGRARLCVFVTARRQRPTDRGRRAVPPACGCRLGAGRAGATWPVPWH
ncbi:hypothetical protein D3C81_1607440 [compost metagenome]